MLEAGADAAPLQRERGQEQERPGGTPTAGLPEAGNQRCIGHAVSYGDSLRLEEGGGGCNQRHSTPIVETNQAVCLHTVRSMLT